MTRLYVNDQEIKHNDPFMSKEIGEHPLITKFIFDDFCNGSACSFIFNWILQLIKAKNHSDSPLRLWKNQSIAIIYMRMQPSDTKLMLIMQINYWQNDIIIVIINK